MLRAVGVIRKPAVKDKRVADVTWLDHKGRHGAHGSIKSHGGLEIVLELDKGPTLNDGDALKLEDGRLIQVRAAPEHLLQIEADNPVRLVRLAWHMGQRRVSAEFKAGAIYVEDDDALAEMARGQGCAVTRVVRPFQPERSTDEHACEHPNHRHGHHHHGDAPGHGSHEHGHACGHDHGHKHEH